MEKRGWTDVVPGFYMCVSVDRRCTAHPDDRLYTGEFYENLHLDAEEKLDFVQRNDVQTKDFAVIVRVKDEKEQYEAICVGIQSVEQFDRYLYGPLREEEIAKFEAQYTKEWRAKMYFYKFLEDAFMINPGDEVQVIRNGVNLTGTLRCKGNFPMPAQMDEMVKEKMWLAVELSPKFAGMGNCDGVVDSFSCGKNCALRLKFDDLCEDRRCTVTLAALGEGPFKNLPENLMNFAFGALLTLMDEHSSEHPDKIILVETLKEWGINLPFLPEHQVMCVKTRGKLIKVYGSSRYDEDIALAKNLPEVSEGATQMRERMRPDIREFYKQRFRYHSDIQDDGVNVTVTLTGLKCQVESVRRQWEIESPRLAEAVKKTTMENAEREIPERYSEYVTSMGEQVRIIHKTSSTLNQSETLTLPAPGDTATATFLDPALPEADPKEPDPEPLELPETSAEQIETCAIKQKRKKKKKKTKKRTVSQIQTPDEHPSEDAETLTEMSVAAVDAPEPSAESENLEPSSAFLNHEISELAPAEPSIESDNVDLGQADVEIMHDVVIPDEFVENPPVADTHLLDECVVCLSEQQSVAFIPCGHRHTCPECAQAIFEGDNPSCPTCRGEIQQLIRIWI